MEAIRKRYHVVCIPAPAQGHINPMFKLAKLLHSEGFHVTFVHTDFNYTRLTNSSLSSSSHSGSSFHKPGTFRFETIPDGLPADNKRGVQDLPALCLALSGTGPKEALRSLLLNLLAPSSDNNVPPVTCMILDAHINFAYEVCKELGIPILILYTPSASSVLAYLHFDQLVQRGLFPLKDESKLTDGFLDTPIDWIPGFKNGAKLKHLPAFLRTTDPNDIMFNYSIEAASHAIDSGSIILNTFDDLDGEVLQGIRTKIPNICTIGPLSLLSQQQQHNNNNGCELQEFGSNLWKEDTVCLEWLDKRSPKSVVYINYGSLTTLSSEQVKEFAWGLANSKQHFLWVIRNNLVDGDDDLGFLSSKEYMDEIKETGMVSGWCAQEKVLKHPAIGAFLTHCGWNSIMESVSEGVPMICWPFFADQQTNSFYVCDEWGNGVEMEEGEVKRGRVEEVVREMMEGEIGEQVRKNALEWKKKADEATAPGGSSHHNFENLVRKIIDMDNNS